MRPIHLKDDYIHLKLLCIFSSWDNIDFPRMESSIENMEQSVKGVEHLHDES